MHCVNYYAISASLDIKQFLLQDFPWSFPTLGPFPELSNTLTSLGFPRLSAQLQSNETAL